MVQKTLSSYIRKGLKEREDSERETVFVPTGWRQLNALEKRKLVQEIVTRNGTIDAQWGKDDQKPFWYPVGVPYKCPSNNRGEKGNAK
eukprot:Seg3141.1 transcript_id=Seg3141.1/GoldUCD/mRNA.D3Y31 product="hypothetical protein" protein_id=Seg3141.1/GoldUCD/D3Y31